MSFVIDCTDADLDNWLDNNINALFEGLHGVGKTTRALKAFARKLGNTVPLLDGNGEVIGEQYVPGVLGQDFLYFSCPTIDPWVDFAGVPRTVKKIINGKEVEVLELVRPYALASGQVKGILLDEFNRAPKKVRNAAMELIQFKSINGFRFPNLRVVWAAINPDDDANMEFNVEPLDPAQRDRFHVQVEISYKPDRDYFTSVFGAETAKAACDWWDSLTDDVKKKVSPRRLEEAVKANQVNLGLRAFLPKESNPPKLHQALRNGMPEIRFRQLMQSGDKAEARKWLAKSNNLDAIQKIIVAEDPARKFALPLVDTERLSGMLAKQPQIKAEVLSNPFDYKDLIRELAAGAQNEILKNNCKKLLAMIESSDGPEPINQIRLEVAPVPKTVAKKELVNLEINYRLADDTYPTLSDTKKENGDCMYPPFEGDFVNEARKIAQFCNLSATNTYYRGQAIDMLAGIATKAEMSKDEMTACFRFLEFIASHSNTNTVYKNPLFPLILNTLVKVYRQHEPKASSSDLFKAIPNVYYRYFGSTVDRDESVKHIISKLAIRPKPDDELVDPIEHDPSLQSIVI